MVGDRLAASGSGSEAGLDLAAVDLTGWYWIALLAAAGCVATTWLAVRSLPAGPRWAAGTTHPRPATVAR